MVGRNEILLQLEELRSAFHQAHEVCNLPLKALLEKQYNIAVRLLRTSHKLKQPILPITSSLSVPIIAKMDIHETQDFLLFPQELEDIEEEEENEEFCKISPEDYKLIGLDPKIEERKMEEYLKNLEEEKLNRIERQKKREKRVKELRKEYAKMRGGLLRNGKGDEKVERGKRLKVVKKERKKKVHDLNGADRTVGVVKKEGCKEVKQEVAEYKIRNGRNGKCQLCGKWQSWLRRHLRSVHGLAEEEMKLSHRDRQPPNTKNPIRKCPIEGCSVYRTRFERHWKNVHNVCKVKNPERYTELLSLMRMYQKERKIHNDVKARISLSPDENKNEEN